MTETFDGCRRACRTMGEHTGVWGECEFGLMPPCEHPTEDLHRSSDSRDIECNACLSTVTLEEVVSRARVALYLGCTCPGDDECGDDCGSRPTAWNLDPEKVLKILMLEGR